MKFLTVFLCLLLASCTIMDGGAVVTGNTRAPISPQVVKLYREAPEKFDEIAIVSSSAGHDFRKNSGLMDSAVERLKEEAAKVGANGVILLEIKDRDAPSTTTSFGSAYATGSSGTASVTGSGVGVNRGDSHTRLRGVAVYVPAQ